MINSRHIPAILAILQEGSITAASKKLLISQPALSQTIRSVERDLGTPLFVRENGAIQLTSAGRLYVDAAQQIQSIDQNLRSALRAFEHDLYGEFSLGISNQRGLQLLPLVFPVFHRLYPHILIRLHEESSGRLERLISEGGFDVAFITTSTNRNRLRYLLIENEQVVLIAAKDTALAKRIPDGQSISISEAAWENFISMCEGHSVRTIQDRLFVDYGISPRIILETHNLEAAKYITAASSSVFLVPNVYVPRDTASRSQIHVYPILNPNYERHFYFCYRQGMSLTVYQKDLVRIVCETLGVPFRLPEEESPGQEATQERSPAP